MHHVRGSATRTVSVTTAELNDVDGIVAAFATSTSPVVKSGAGLNGAALDANKVLKPLPRAVTITTGTQAATYNTSDPIVVTGRRGGEPTTEELMLTLAGGSETVRGTKAFDRIDSIAFPAQLGGAGQFEVGVGDVCAHAGDKLCFRLRAIATGYVRVRHDSDGVHEHSLSCVADRHEDVAPLRVLADPDAPDPTAVDFVLYM
jgi:hypothetical protein